MRPALFFLILIAATAQVHAQDTNCKVLQDSISGVYAGECKNGKAHGTGKATGVHTYEGDFKNGLPEGTGKYTWANGDYYSGSWKKGLKDGKGQLHRFEKGIEHLVEGYWKKGNYRGEYEFPYVITNVTSDVGRVQVEKISDDENSITVTVENLASSSSLNRNTFQTTTTMTSHQVIRGQYISKSASALPNKEITIFRGVIFPFRCTFNFGNTIVEIEFFDKAAWNVMIPINK